MRRLRPIAILLALAALGVAAPERCAAGDAEASDAAFRDGWRLLGEERYGEAAAAFSRIPPDGTGLGDYVLYFRGVAEAARGRFAEAAEALAALQGSFPDSFLAPYLAHEIAWAAAREDDLATARTHLAASRGKVTGNGRQAAEGYVAARLLEEEPPARPATGNPGGGNGPDGEGSGDPPAPDPDGPPPLPAVMGHLENVAAHAVQEGAILSMERLWKWRAQGRLSRLDLPVTFAGKLARGLALAGENDRARAVYREAVRSYPPSDDYYAVVLDYAEFLRRQWDTRESRELLARAQEGAPPGLRAEIDFLFARVDLKAGRQTDARARFLDIAAGTARPALAERARYHAAWIAEEAGDLETAAAEFGALREARDESIRQEAAFRHAFALHRTGKAGEAVDAISRGEKAGFSSVERARHAFWRGRALDATGKAEAAAAILSALSSDPGAGPYALFAARAVGREPFAMLAAPPSGETRECAAERQRLWERVLSAPWREEDTRVVRRVERLSALGVTEYAVLESERIDRARVKEAVGVVESGSPGLFRYLAGDLRGAIRETNGIAVDPAAPAGLVDRLQFPLDPGAVGDCEAKKSGIDPLVLHAVIRQESQFQQNALSPAGAVGLMQLMPRTAAETARREKKRPPRRRDLLDPGRNVDLGAAYLARLVRAYGGDYVRAVAAYNAGENAVARWWEEAKGDPALFLETISYRETRFYVRRVFFNLLQYYRIYRPATLARYFPTPTPIAPPDPGAAGTPPAASTPGDAPGPRGTPGGEGAGG